MKNLFLMIFVFFNLIGINIYSQDIVTLKENNGFRNIKLGSNIEDYSDLIIKDSTNIKFFGVWDEYDYILHPDSEMHNSIENTKIHRVLIKTYNSYIYEIFITLEYNFEVVELLKSLYGKPNYTDGSNVIWDYAWTIDNILCRLFDDNHIQNDGKPFRLYYIDKNLRSKVWELERKVKLEKAKKGF
jgi:hypothetical protein